MTGMNKLDWTQIEHGLTIQMNKSVSFEQTLDLVNLNFDITSVKQVKLAQIITKWLYAELHVNETEWPEIEKRDGLGSLVSQAWAQK
jgi:hypothetical protein